MNDAYKLLRVPDEIVPLAIIGIGGAMLVVIMVLHGFGLDRIVARYRLNGDRMRASKITPHLAVLVFAWSILQMLGLHLAEICLWGTLLWMGGLVHDLHVAVYFGANAYTTLGMGNMALPHNWHEMSPMIAISGLFAFAWTTSELFNIVGDQHDLVKELSAERQPVK